MAKRLPTRPRVVAGLPVLRRQAGELQIGLDPRHATVVDGLSDAVVAAALRLTGVPTGEQLAAGLTATDRRELCALLGTLLDRGLLENATSSPARLAGETFATQVRALSAHDGARDPSIDRSRLAVGVHGDGRLAVAVGVLLATAGVGWVHVSATGTVRPEDTGTGYLPEDVGAPRLVAARRALRRAEPAVRTTRFDPAHSPDLVVLTDALVPSPERVEAVMAAAVPHLLVRARDTTGIVGPLVVPGVTGCLRCADLHRSDRDECWPQLATQLAGRTQLTDLAGTHATAAFAVAQVFDAAAWLWGGTERPATCETSAELDLRTASVRHRAWTAHPGCPCRAGRRDSAGHVRCAKVAADSAEELRQSKRDGDAS
jgi:bacteriocin biosynthesis cyclodehydratase domain-containing protein